MRIACLQVIIGGLVGWDADQQFRTDDFAGQVRQVLENIVAVLAEGGATPEHLVRLTWYVTDKHEYDPQARLRPVNEESS